MVAGTCGGGEVSPEEGERKTPSVRTYLNSIVMVDIRTKQICFTGSAVAAAKGELWMGRTRTAVKGEARWRLLGFIIASLCNSLDSGNNTSSGAGRASNCHLTILQLADLN